MASPSRSGVGGQEDVRSLGPGFLELLDQVALVFHGEVLGVEILIGVDAEGGLGQVAYMAHGGGHQVLVAQDLADSAGLGR